MFKIYIIIFTLYNLFYILIANKCNQRRNKNAFKFSLIRRHSRATEFVILEKLLSTIEQCREFSLYKNALAFNFYSQVEIKNHQRVCQILSCPEMNVNSLIHDKKSSYYSLYSNDSVSAENYTMICLPRIGIFVVSKKSENYTNAQLECEKMRGKLADIISPERNIELSKYISGMSTYVGLSERDKKKRWENEFDEPLSCFEYRAWAPGEPSSRGCATLTTFSTHKGTNLSPVWKSVPCSHSLPFICEILPNELNNNR